MSRLSLAFVSTEDSSSPRSWSGIPYYMARALVEQGVTLHIVGPLQTPLAPLVLVRGRQLLHRSRGRWFAFRYDRGVVQAHARQVASRLRDLDVNAVFSPGTIPIAYLDTPLPVIYWSDATFGAMVDYYPAYSVLSEASVRAAGRMESVAIGRADAAIYASTWAAESALRVYGADPKRVHVVPFGANLANEPDRRHVASLIAKRPRRECRLLFVGVDWQRKGGDLALGVVERLVEMGVPSRLTVVGCRAGDVPGSRLVDNVGFVDKSTPLGEAALGRVYGASHFLCLPSRAECFGIVFCEASAYGVPSVAIRTGGVASAVSHGSNGYLFDEARFIESAAVSIAECMADYDAVYTPLALSSHEEYRSRLNWATSTKQVVEHVRRLVARNARAE